MVPKSVIVCVFALFQVITSQCIGNSLNGLRPGLNGNGLAANILAGNSMLANGLANAGLGLNGLGLAGNGLGLAGNAANGIGLAGNGIGLAGNGIGLAGNGIGLAGNGIGLAGNGIGNGCVGTASTGGGLAVSSASPVAPIGVSVVSENVYEGGLSVGGNLPLLGTVGLEGTLPTAGAGAVSYGCGDGAVGIATEGPIATGIVSPGTYGPNVAAAGPGVGLNGLAGYNGLGRIGYGPGCGI